MHNRARSARFGAYLLAIVVRKLSEVALYGMLNKAPEQQTSMHAAPLSQSVEPLKLVGIKPDSDAD